jgi:hypothetical protein
MSENINSGLNLEDIEGFRPIVIQKVEQLSSEHEKQMLS